MDLSTSYPDMGQWIDLTRRRVFVAIILLALCVFISSVFERYEPSSQLEEILFQATTMEISQSVATKYASNTITSSSRIKRFARQISEELIMPTDPGFRLSDFDGAVVLYFRFYQEDELLATIYCCPGTDMQNLVYISVGSSNQCYLWSGWELLEPYYYSMLMRYDAANRAYRNERNPW